MAFRVISTALLAMAATTATAQMPAPPSGLPVRAAPAAAPAAALPTGSGVRPAEGYRLGTGDEIEVTMFGPSNQVTRSRIKEDGTITLPYLGSVKAVGLTAREFAGDVSARLKSGGYFVKPVVSVDVTQFVSNSVTVFGEVGSPGVYPLDRELTLAQMLARAGGARNGGADFVLLRREGDPAEHRAVVADLTGEWSSATPMKPGDIIYVPVAPQVYIYGQVNGPGSFEIRQGMTVRQVLVRAGGPTLAGSEKNIQVYRDGKKIKKVDLEGKVQPGDILFVKEKLF